MLCIYFHLNADLSLNNALFSFTHQRVHVLRNGQCREIIQALKIGSWLVSLGTSPKTWQSCQTICVKIAFLTQALVFVPFPPASLDFGHWVTSVNCHQFGSSPLRSVKVRISFFFSALKFFAVWEDCPIEISMNCCRVQTLKGLNFFLWIEKPFKLRLL